MVTELPQPTSSADEFRILSQMATNTVLALAAFKRGRLDEQLLQDAKHMLTILRQASPPKIKGLKRFEARLVEKASTALADPETQKLMHDDIIGPTHELVCRLLDGKHATAEEFPVTPRAQAFFSQLSVRFGRSAVAGHRALKSERSLSKCA